MIYPGKPIAIGFCLLGLFLLPVVSKAQERKSNRPNIVLIFVDDMGYGDLGCYGSKTKTPNLDKMAKQGIRFTDFYAAQAVCSASRAALLTGCYPNRVSIYGALGPRTKYGIGRQETTIAELLKAAGYTTGIFGKWHLGHLPQHLPHNHGFDEYYGLPYSNDMWPFHPTNKSFPKLPLISGKKIIEYNPDQTKLTTDYTKKAVDFINRHKKEPFFLYLAHSMPHVPLFVSEMYKGKSKQGLYGDVIQEIDWSVGQVLDALQKNGLDENTLVIFTSDNGPWLSYGTHGGSAGPLREGKGTTWEGGVREPCIMRWPGKIPPGQTCPEPAMTIDVLPTVAHITKAKLPKHKIDGKNIWPLMAGKKEAKSPHDALFFYWSRHLQGVRSGKWKLYFPHTYRTLNGRPGGKGGIPVRYEQGKIGMALYDLRADIGEQKNIIEQHPDVVRRMQAMADAMREDLGDSATKQKGKGVRPVSY